MRGLGRRLGGLLLLTLSLTRCAGGAKHPQATNSVEGDKLVAAGIAQSEAGNYALAESLLERGVAATKRERGPDAIETAAALTSLAGVYSAQLKFTAADIAIQSAIAIEAKTPGWLDSKQTAFTLLTRGGNSERLGECHFARIELEAAEKTFSRLFGPESVQVSIAMGARARCLIQQQQTAEAEALLKHAIAIRERALGATSWVVGSGYKDLAACHLAQRRVADAEREILRALAILEGSLGPEHPRVADALQTLSQVYVVLLPRGPAEAQKVLERALRVQERVFGKQSAVVGKTLNDLVVAQWQMGQWQKVADTTKAALEISERSLIDSFDASGGVEGDFRLEYANKLRFEQDRIISLQAHLPSPDVRRLAATTLLRRKGRILELVAQKTDVLRSHVTAATVGLLNGYLQKQRGIARLRFADAIANGTGEVPGVSQLQAQSSELAVQLLGVGGEHSALRGAFRWNEPSPDVSQVIASLPPDSALVEYVSYADFFPAPNDFWSSARYGAFVIQRSGAVDFVPLGDAAPIDERVELVRRDLRDPSLDPKPNARALDDLVMRPLRRYLGGAHHVYLATDSRLSEVPFAALVDDGGDYLLKNWTFSYLTSGRELLSFARRARKPRSSAVVFADPAFGGAGADTGIDAASDRAPSIDSLSRVRFSRLPGTVAEGRAVSQLLNAQLVQGAAATADAVAAVHGPRVLHLATHGFFLTDGNVPERAGRGLVLDAPPARNLSDTDALLRSGLVLAGANVPRRPGDALLTAAEAAALDLDGTQLVTLSACQTALGDAWAGQGVRGLQQALTWAGARALLMSLWNVDDRATSALMVAAYRAMGRGLGLATALREAQLELSGSSTFAHPYFWSSFIHYGDPSPLTPPG